MFLFIMNFTYQMEIFNAHSGRELLLLMAVSLNALELGTRRLSNTQRPMMKFNVV